MSCSCTVGAELWRFLKRFGPTRFGHVSQVQRRAWVFGLIITIPLHAHFPLSTIDNYNDNPYCKYTLRSLIQTVIVFLHNIDYALPIMIDATLPTLRSTSSEADPRPTSSSIASSSESDVYSFLVHSPHSIVNGELPEVDNGKLAPQKRKRTR